MIGFDPKLAAVMTDIDVWRRREREGRESSIREQTERMERGAARLVGHLPPGDAVFGRPVVPVAEPEPAGLSRGAVFAHLRAGGDPAALPKEAEPFVADYQMSKQALGWR